MNDCYVVLTLAIFQYLVGGKGYVSVVGMKHIHKVSPRVSLLNYIHIVY